MRRSGSIFKAYTLTGMLIVFPVAGSSLGLLDAAKVDDFAAVESILKGKVDINATQANGATALAYSRVRETSSDYARMKRQRCVLAAMTRQLDPVVDPQLAAVTAVVLDPTLKHFRLGSFGIFFPAFRVLQFHRIFNQQAVDLFFGRVMRLLAFSAQPLGQTLRQYAQQRIGKIERVHAHVQ